MKIMLLCFAFPPKFILHPRSVTEYLFAVIGHSVVAWGLIIGYDFGLPSDEVAVVQPAVFLKSFEWSWHFFTSKHFQAKFGNFFFLESNG